MYAIRSYYAHGEMAAYKVPRLVEFVDALPRSGSGKIQWRALQVHATQMAPEARGAAVSLFALCLFTSQSIGIWLAARAIDAWGIVPVFAAAGIGLPLVALDFRRRLARHRDQTPREV